MDAFGTAVSMSLQYGVPLEDYVRKFSHMRFEPQGYTKNPDIRIAKSLIDYIFRWLGITFLPGYKEASMGVLPASGRRVLTPGRRTDDAMTRIRGARASQEVRVQEVGGQGQDTKPRPPVAEKAGSEGGRREDGKRMAAQTATLAPSPQSPAPNGHANGHSNGNGHANGNGNGARQQRHQRRAAGPRRHDAQRTPARTRPAANNSPTSNPTPRPATTAARSPSATAIAICATTAAVEHGHATLREDRGRRSEVRKKEVGCRRREVRSDFPDLRPLTSDLS